MSSNLIVATLISSEIPIESFDFKDLSGHLLPPHELGKNEVWILGALFVGLKITACHQTMFTQDGNLTGQKLHPQVMLTSHGLLYSTKQN